MDSTQPAIKDEKCPSCQSSKTSPYLENQEDHLVQCGQCDLVFTIHKNEPGEIYNQKYFEQDGAHGYESYADEYTTHHATFSHRIRQSEKWTGTKGKVLDYGCALGHLARTAIELGWQAFGTDVSKFALETTQKTGAKVFEITNSKALKENSPYNLITLYDVIEHTKDFNDMLKNIHGLLNSNGVLHITTPDIESWSAKLMRGIWYHLKPGEHVVLFSKKSIRIALEANGYEIIKISPSPSHMTIHDILKRLTVYSKPVFGSLDWLAQKLGFGKRIIPIYTGELQVWAKRSPETPAQKKLSA